MLKYSFMDWNNLLNELKAYPQGVAEEVRKIDWPSREEVVKLTSVALVVVAVAAIYVAGLDYILSRVIQFIIAA